MTIELLHSEGHKCQCAYPNDCGPGGCAADCGPQVAFPDLKTTGLLDHQRVVSDDLWRTCCDPGDPVHFDFGNGYDQLVTAWPYVTARSDGYPVYVVLPPRRPLRFCVEGGDGACLGGGSYVYAPGAVAACPDIEQGTARSADKLRYQLGYDTTEDEFVFVEEGSIWRFVGFKLWYRGQGTLQELAGGWPES